MKLLLFYHDFFISFIWGYPHTKFEVSVPFFYAYRELWPEGRNDPPLGSGRVRKSPVLIGLNGIFSRRLLYIFALPDPLLKMLFLHIS